MESTSESNSDRSVIGGSSPNEWGEGLSFVQDEYREAFKKYGVSQAAVMWPKGRQSERFASLIRSIDKDQFSVLDYGCGLGDLYGFLVGRYGEIDYLGVDLLPEFVEAARSRYPAASFECKSKTDEIVGVFDHVVVCGTFNLWPANLASPHLVILEEIARLFEVAKKSLSMNFMTSHVDFVQENAVHFDPSQMRTFCRERLSPRVLLDETYLPYEFTITVLKETSDGTLKTKSGSL